MVIGQIPNLAAAVVVRINEAEQAFELLDRKTQIAAAQDKAEPRLVAGCIEPVPDREAMPSERVRVLKLFRSKPDATRRGNEYAPCPSLTTEPCHLTFDSLPCRPPF